MWWRGDVEVSCTSVSVIQSCVLHVCEHVISLVTSQSLIYSAAFSFCERRSLDLSTVKAILSWIVKSLSARTISRGSSLSNIPQCSVIYLSETCPPLAFEMNDIVPWGLLLSIFSEYCVVCIVLFGNEWYCTLGGCYYQHFHSIVLFGNEPWDYLVTLWIFPCNQWCTHFF